MASITDVAMNHLQKLQDRGRLPDGLKFRYAYARPYDVTPTVIFDDGEYCFESLLSLNGSDQAIMNRVEKLAFKALQRMEAAS